MPIPPPPPKQLALSLLIERLHLKVPQWAGLVVLAVVLPTGAWVALGDSRGTPPVGPVPTPASPPVAFQSSTASAFPPVLAMVGRLPQGSETQKKPPCDPDLEEAIGEWCWIPLDAKPCPERKAFEHNGKCYIRALRAARAPSSGEPHLAPVAAPPE